MSILSKGRLSSGAVALAAVFAVAACQDQEVTSLQTLDDLVGDAATVGAEQAQVLADDCLGAG